jgi:hypothetical protein
MGLLIALWRDRTFQSISLTILMVVFSVAGVELFAVAFPTVAFLGVPVKEILSPIRAMLAVLYPRTELGTGVVHASSLVYVGIRLSFAALIVAFGTWKLRTWNPGRNEPREQADETETQVVESLYEVNEEQAEVPVAVGAEGVSSADSRRGGIAERALSRDDSGEGMSSDLPFDDSTGATTGLHVPRRTHRRVAAPPRTYRKPWVNPILWRELMTRAYGTRPLIIKGCYLLLFALGVGFFHFLGEGMANPLGSSLALIAVGLAILSLILINAQGVTALTSERDSGSLDLLLVTELSPGDFIYGKLYGILYNSKEMVVLPLLFTIYLWLTNKVSGENTVFFLIDYLLLCHFAAMLGLHSAISFTSSRVAIANSLGTLFLLMVGILFCAWVIIQSDREFGRQLLSFMIFIGAGSVALFGSLGAKNPSRAIALVSLLTPFWTFYCIISLINGDFLAAFLVSVGVYGFALLAMLVPAVGDFDIALGRTSAIQG